MTKNRVLKTKQGVYEVCCNHVSCTKFNHKTLAQCMTNVKLMLDMLFYSFF